MAENNNNNERSFVEIEDELNAALGKIGETRDDPEKNIERVSALTVQELLEQLKIDEFEKMYITTAAQSVSPTNEEVSEEKMEQVQTLAEYELSQMDEEEEVSIEDQKKLKVASNFYLIPHEVNYRYSVGNAEQVRTMELYTVNDVEGHSLYTVIDNKNISICNSFKSRIKRYLEENYEMEVLSGAVTPDEVIDHFTPEDITELYDMLGDESILTMRFLPDRIDEFLEERGIETKDAENKELLEKYREMEERNIASDNEPVQDEEQEELEAADVDTDSTTGSATTIDSKDKPEPTLEEDEGETLEEPDGFADKVRDGASIRLKEDVEEKEEKVESYVEKIARLNHVKPAVVNTRVVENFEKVEEDTGIPLKGRYPRGEVIAVRIPYKLAYRTFLVEKSTGMTIDGKGLMDRKPGKFYDFDEIEDYFRFKLRDGHDGGDDGKPLTKDEGRDYTTYLDEDGEIQEEKYINNGREDDMLHEERQRYLTEVSEVDKRLKEAIEVYQKHATKENYQKVRDIIQEKVNIDNKYNALDEQRKVTEKTTENAEKILKEKEKEKDDDDDWFPGFPGGRYH